MVEPGSRAAHRRDQARPRSPGRLRMGPRPRAHARAGPPVRRPLLSGPRRPRSRNAGPVDPGRRLARPPAGPAPQGALAGRHEGRVKPLAVVCVSGGMDSAVTAAIAALTHRLAFLHAGYGQRTEAKERECFSALGDHYAVERRLVIDLATLRAVGGSSLTDRALAVREGEPEPGVVPTSYVPFRNAHLLAAATSWAEVIGASA